MKNLGKGLKNVRGLQVCKERLTRSIYKSGSRLSCKEIG